MFSCVGWIENFGSGWVWSEKRSAQEIEIHDFGNDDFEIQMSSPACWTSNFDLT